MAKHQSIDLKITTHTTEARNIVLLALKTALKPLKDDGTIWTITGASQEYYTPDTFSLDN